MVQDLVRIVSYHKLFFTVQTNKESIHFDLQCNERNFNKMSEVIPSIAIIYHLFLSLEHPIHKYIKMYIKSKKDNCYLIQSFNRIPRYICVCSKGDH